MAETTASESIRCETMAAMATVGIYRDNLFRILELPVSASSRDVQRQQARRQMQAKLGLDGQTKGRGPLALDPAPSEDDQRRALEQLNQPSHRLLHEVFWFWPIEDGQDPALKAISNGDVECAKEIWTASLEGDSAHVGAHNLAILGHLQLLDAEAGPGGLADRSVSWTDVFTHWNAVVESEEIWVAIRDRVRELDDAQLTTGYVRRIRDSLPVLLLTINARLASAAAERGDEESARQHLETLQSSPFDETVVRSAVRDAVAPIRRRINASVETAKARWEASPEHAHRHVRDLRAHTEVALQALEIVLVDDPATIGSLKDLVADAMRDGGIAYGNKTNDWEECVKLIQLARETAAGEALRDRLDGDRGVIEQNVEHANDWCSRGYWDLDPAAVAELEEARRLVTAGDYAGALQELVAMDHELGKPLIRCTAYTLSNLARKISDEAIDAWDRPLPRLAKFLDVINRDGSVSVPDPSMQTWQLPACPSCGSSGYTRWVNGEYKGQKYWMCSTCSEHDDRVQDDRRERLKGELVRALEHILLAVELDSRSKGLTDQLETLKELAKTIEARVPKTKAIKGRLKEHRSRASFVDEPEAPKSCHFCGSAHCDPDHAIAVRMHGDARETRMLFGMGSVFGHTVVHVPRCRRCRDMHWSWPQAVEQWHADRAKALGDWNFEPEFMALAQARKGLRAAQSVVGKCEDAARAEEKKLDDAKKLGASCSTCNSAKHWDDGVCTECDRDDIRITPMEWTITTLFASAALVATVIFATSGTTMMMGFAGTVVVGAVGAGIGWARSRKRCQDLRRSREKAIKAKRDAATTVAQDAVDAANKKVAAARAALQGPREAVVAKSRAVRHAKRVRAQQFEEETPEPRHSPDVGLERTYLKFASIRELRDRGWSFGDRPDADDKHTDGLVGRFPAVLYDVVLYDVGPNVDAVRTAVKEAGAPDPEEGKTPTILLGGVDLSTARAISSKIGSNGAKVRVKTTRSLRESATMTCADCGTKCCAAAPEQEWSVSERRQPFEAPTSIDCQCGAVVEVPDSIWPSPYDIDTPGGGTLPAAADGKEAPGDKSDRHREQAKVLAATNDPDTFVACPVCRTETKARNLLRHMHKQHNGGDAPTQDPNRCPKCGFTLGWDGHICSHCGHGGLETQRNKFGWNQ